MRKFLAGAAAIALASTMAHADPGKGNSDNRGNSSAQVKGGGPAKADRGGAAKTDRGQAAKAERDSAAKSDNAQVAQSDRGPPAKAEEGASRPDRGAAAKTPEDQRGAERDQRPAKVERQIERRGGNRGNDRALVERRNRDGDRARRVSRVIRIDHDRNRGLIDGCPPGLAKKNNACMPPGLLRDRREDFAFRQAYYRPDWWGYRSLGSRVYYDDGYLYRLANDNSILGYIPLLGGALSVGNVWPSYYDPVPVPDYYVDYYNLGQPRSYRYADDVLYRLDPQTSSITGIAALLTGDDIAIGQTMPAGYDVYNVPYPYRDRYYDTPDAQYRYADGYVYRIDPETRLVAAAIQLLT